MTMVPSTKPSSNWLALQKTLAQHSRPRKRRRIFPTPPNDTLAFPRNTPSSSKSGNANEHVDLGTAEVKNGESLATLRGMVLGIIDDKASQTGPGKYLALDCEMVGVGIDGSESSLARVSIVNYAGAVILDVFVRQCEKVVDYRTQWSGVRSTDLAGSAKPFKEVQQTVADLIKDRILVGHAIYNDLKALLLSHPSPQIRDTQSLAYKYHIVKSRRPALRVLVKQELDIVIQGGEHSSVTDARATMALFRLYRKQWESSFRRSHAVARPHSDPDGKAVAPIPPSPSPSVAQGRKRRRSDDHTEVAELSQSLSGPRTCSQSLSNASHTRVTTHDIPTPSKHPQRDRSQRPAKSGPRKGASSGISAVVRRAGGTKEVWVHGGQKGGGPRGRKTGATGDKWWRRLGGGKKDSIKL